MLLRINIGLLYFTSFLTWAQYTPEKTQNNDLRSKKQICSINISENKKTTFFSLDSNAAGQFHLVQKEDEKTMLNKKIDSDMAKNIDEKFVEGFIEMKYMMTSKVNDKCENDSYSLFMRGDILTVCKNDKARVTIVNNLIKLLK